MPKHAPAPYPYQVINGFNTAAPKFNPPDGNQGVALRNAQRRADHGYLDECWHLVFNSAGGATIVQVEAQICGGTYNAAHNTIEGGLDLGDAWDPWARMQNAFAGGGGNRGAQSPAELAAMLAVIGPDEKPAHSHHP